MEPFFKPQAEDAILLLISPGLTDFVQNVLASIERCGVSESDICIALTQNALSDTQAAVGRWPRVRYFFLEHVCNADYSWMREYKNFGSDDFGVFTISKWLAIRFLLRSGFRRVTYTDVDVAWMRNPMPILRAILQSHDVAIQTEGSDDYPPSYCTGFMSWRKSEFALQLLDNLERFHREGARADPRVHDQLAFFHYIRTSQHIMRNIYSLSEQLFANGLMAPAIAFRDADLIGPRQFHVSPMIFHANWTKGTDEKRLLLKRTGNWLIE
jgi:hypothetical protein